MVDLQIHFFGHFYNQYQNNDKIWGYMEAGGKFYTFWGKRGPYKSIRFKQQPMPLMRNDWINKIQKGYNPISLNQDKEGNYPAIDQIYPGFVANCRKHLTMGIMLDKIK